MESSKIRIHKNKELLRLTKILLGNSKGTVILILRRFMPLKKSTAYAHLPVCVHDVHFYSNNQDIFGMSFMGLFRGHEGMLLNINGTGYYSVITFFLQTTPVTSKIVVNNNRFHVRKTFEA